MKQLTTLLHFFLIAVFSHAQNVGIGTTTPEAQLHVNGTFKFTNGTPASGKVLTSDATGNVSWQPNGLTIPFAATNSTSGPLFSLSHTGTAGAAGYFATSGTNASHSLQGINNSDASGASGVYGQVIGSQSGTEYSGVYGVATGAGNQTAGVRGRATNGGYGVAGSSGSGSGLYGIANAAGGNGAFVVGLNGATALSTYGPIQMSNIGEGAGKVLTSDGVGKATWQTLPTAPAAWGLSGNGSTNSTTNFIGTTDGTDINFRRNNLKSGVLGANNTAFGYESQRNASSFYNTSLGTGTLKNATGDQNTAVGFNALLVNSTGEDNTAVGAYALSSNLTGKQNVAIGRTALTNNQSTDDLVAVGNGALYSTGINGGVGDGAGSTAVGSNALFSNLSGTENTALGYYAMQKNITGYYNTAAGWKAMTSNTNGHSNSAFGDDALGSNTSGVSNSAVGLRALFSNTTGNNNTGLGNFAGVDLPGSVSNVTCVGYGAGRPTAVSNQVYLGNTSVTQIIAQVTGITAYSDGRIKENVKENVGGLSFIMALRPVTYNVNLHTENRLLGIKTEMQKGYGPEAPDKYALEQTTQTGFIAQEVETAAKKAGYQFSGLSVPKNNQGLYGINYTEFVVPLVKAMQEQQALIEKLQQQIEAGKTGGQQTIIEQQNKKIAQQQQLIEAMEKRLTTLENNK